MTVQEMDICLNVSSDPATFQSSQLQSTKDFSSSIKRLKHTSAKEERQNFVKDRINQKKVTFANKVKDSHESNKQISKKEVPDKVTGKTPDLVKKSQSENKDNTKTVVKNDSLSKKDLMVNDDFITFNKRKAIESKSIVVQKQTGNKREKKSLSDIFTSNNRKEAFDFKRPNSRDTKTNVIEDDDDGDDEIVPTKKLKLDKSNKSKIKKSKDKSEKLKHSTGKISSLFGNNPEVPNIGQRLVKPINEVVFTGTLFSDLDIHPFMVSNLEQNLNIKDMTIVQQKGIPKILSGQDVLIRSQTGSGKTLAYALPIVEFLHKVRPKLSRSDGLKALVIVPTRELALQTYECFLKLVKPFTWIVPGYLTGGEKRKAEKARLRRGCSILIATPGRLLDHIKHTEALKLNDVKYLVLDEADRMLDMGYEKDVSGIVDALKYSKSPNSDYDAMKMLRQNVRKVFSDEEESSMQPEGTEINIQKVSNDSSANSESEDEDFSSVKASEKNENKTSDSNPEDTKNDEPQRQTILLSATLTQAVEKLAGLTTKNPVFVDAAKDNYEISKTGDVNEDLIVPQEVTQSYVVTPPKLRMVTLSAYIAHKCQRSGQHKIVIFMATQDMVDYHMDMLSSILTKPVDEDDEDSDPLVDVEFFKLYGNMSQKERTEVFKTFRKAKSGVLLCTDVAARGLDLPKVDSVIQYTGPISTRDYVHRIGRTARAGMSGSAIIFLTPPEVEFIRLLESKRIRIKQEDMNDFLSCLLGPLSKHNSVQAAAIHLQNEFESLLLENKKLHGKACKAYVSWVRFYSTYPREMRDFFNREDLHLGHYAKSFALRDPPQRIGGIGKKLRGDDSKEPKHNNRLTNDRPNRVPLKKQQNGSNNESRNDSSFSSSSSRVFLRNVRMLNTSEFGSGLEPVKKTRKV